MKNRIGNTHIRNEQVIRQRDYNAGLMQFEIQAQRKAAEAESKYIALNKPTRLIAFDELEAKYRRTHPTQPLKAASVSTEHVHAAVSLKGVNAQ
jgi:hypothetical protein